MSSSNRVALGLVRLVTEVKSIATRISALESSNDVPTGTIAMWAGTSAPTGWLLITSSTELLNRASFPDLFAVIGTTYNTGGESTSTFRLPVMRERVPVGRHWQSSSDFYVLGDTGGAATHTLTEAQVPFRSSGAEAGGYGLTQTGGYLNRVGVNRATGTGTAAHNIMQPYLVLNYIIKT